MAKVIITAETNKIVKIEIIDGKLRKKGFVSNSNGEKLFDDLKKKLFSKDRDMYSNIDIDWKIIQPSVLASDFSTSIICYIPQNTYYIPYVGGKEEQVFKVSYPAIIGVYSKNTVFIYWTEEELSNMNDTTKMYTLQMPHLFSNGTVCKGSFKEEIDFNNPSKYFIDLISYPVSHAKDVYLLRDNENNGYTKKYNNPITIKEICNKFLK